jgi:hypothetical protein
MTEHSVFICRDRCLLYAFAKYETDILVKTNTNNHPKVTTNGEQVCRQTI